MHAMPSVPELMEAQLITTASTSERSKPYRVAELAALFDVDKSTVYRMIYSGLLDCERHGPHRGAIRVPVAAVAKYLRSASAEVAA
jgi:excisionase family DNA binding protein